MNESRTRRPYEKKSLSKGSALIFGLGVGALLLTIMIVTMMMVPYFSDRLDNLAYRARTYYRQLIPHPEYLPTPAPVAAHTTGSNQAAAPPQVIVPTATPTAAPLPTATPSLESAAGEEETFEESPALSPAVDDGPANHTASSGEDTAAISLQPPGNQAQLSGFTHQWQTWNNCGPATITTYMSYFDYTQDQADAALFLKPNRDDKNVSPQELVAYAHHNGLEAILRQGGSLTHLKTFLSNDIPVLVETWLVHDGDGLGHYRLITGFDETSQQFTTTDSLNGPDYTVSYEQLDEDWRVFNRLYIVVYPPERAETVAAIIGEDMDETVMYERLLIEAQADLEVNPGDAIAHFNQGEALTHLGRFEEAVAAFDQARQLGLHWRRLWYQFTPFEAYYAVGRYQDVLDLTQATIRGAGGLEEAYYYHGLALQASGQTGAAEDFEAALAYNPNFEAAAEALAELR